MLCWEDALEEGTEIHWSILAWKIPWTEPEEPAFLRVHGVAFSFAATNFGSLHYIGPVNRSFTEKHTQSFGPGLQSPRSKV